MSSVSVFKEETQAQEKQQPTDAEQGSWWIPRDSASEKGLILVLAKMAEHLLAGDTIPDDGKYEQMSLSLRGNVSSRKVKRRRKRKGKVKKSKTSKRPKDAVLQLKMFD